MNYSKEIEAFTLKNPSLFNRLFSISHSFFWFFNLEQEQEIWLSNNLVHCIKAEQNISNTNDLTTNSLNSQLNSIGQTNTFIDLTYKIFGEEKKTLKTELFFFKTTSNVKCVIGIFEYLNNQLFMYDYIRMFNFSDDLLSIYSNDNRLERINPKWQKTLGYTNDELLKKELIQFIHQDDVAHTNQKIDELIKGNVTAVSFDNRFRAKDGSYKWLEWSSVYNKVEKKIYSIARDITTIIDDKKKKQELNESVLKLNKIANWPNLEVNDFYKQLCYEASKALDITRFSIWKFDGKSNRIICIALHDIENSELNSVKSYAIDQIPIYVNAISSKRIISSTNAQEDPNLIELRNSYLIKNNIKSILDAQIIAEPEPIGIVCAENKNTIKKWTHIEENYVASLAECVWIAKLNYDRIAKEKALNESQANLNATIMSMDDMIFVLDTNGKFVNFISPKSDEYLVHPKIFAGEHFAEILPEDVSKLIERKIKEIKATNKTQSVEYQLNLFGEQRWYQAKISPRKNLKGELLGYTSVSRNISQRKHAEATLMYNNRLQELLMNISTRQINLPLKEIDLSIKRSLAEIGNFVKADRAYIFELNNPDKTCVKTFEWCNTSIKQQMVKTLDYNTLTEINWLEKHQQNEEIYIPNIDLYYGISNSNLLKQKGVKSILSIPLKYGKSLIGFVCFDAIYSTRTYSEVERKLLWVFAGVLTNIKMRQKQQQDLNDLLKTVINKNQRLQDFSFITSHNVRSSVANLLGLSQLIAEEPNNQEYLQMLNKSTKVLDNTLYSINELLNFEDTLNKIQKEIIDFPTLIQEIIEDNQDLIEKKKAKFEIVIDEGIKLYNYQFYIKISLNKIITNALFYGITDENKKIKISVIHNAQNDIVISIQDNGIGIDLDKYKKRLFTVNSRLHTISKGSGLSLFVTKHFIESLGGQIKVESQINRGSTFYIIFSNQETYNSLP